MKDFILFNSKEYPVRIVEFEGEEVMVAPIELEDVLLVDDNYVSKEAQYIDEQIIYFLPQNDLIQLSDSEIVSILESEIGD